jgi:ribosomal small subunit protein bTHX
MRFLVLVCLLACVAICSAFAPTLPFGASRSSRAVASRGPTMFLNQVPSVSVSDALATESLTIMMGRGDKRTKKGKIFAKSFGKVIKMFI